MYNISPVPELSFLPALYRGWTRAGERRVQDNLHAHAQNAAIFSPQIGGKTKFGSIFQMLAPVVQKADSAVHRINHYPADSVVCFFNTYPLDSDLSSG